MLHEWTKTKIKYTIVSGYYAFKHCTQNITAIYINCNIKKHVQQIGVKSQCYNNKMCSSMSMLIPLCKYV